MALFLAIMNPMHFLPGTFLTYAVIAAGSIFAVFLLLQVILRKKTSFVQQSRTAPHAPITRRLLLSMMGLGSIAGAVLAIDVGGPGAMIWLWIATLFAMLLAWTEVRLGFALGQNHNFGLLGAVHQRFGRWGQVIGWVYILLFMFVALTLGALFQSQQSAAITHELAHIYPWATSCTLAILVLLSFFVREQRWQAIMKFTGPILIGGYLVVVGSVLIQDLAALQTAWLTSKQEFLQQISTTPKGFFGALFSATSQYAFLRATFAHKAGLGVASSVAASQKDQGFASGWSVRAMLAPLIIVAFISTPTALLMIIHGQGQDIVGERRLISLERPEQRGLHQSERGQVIVLPEDTRLEAHKSYRMRYLAHPRGHKIGKLFAQENAVVIPLWDITKQADTIVLRDKHPQRADNPGYDLRIASNRTQVETASGTWIKLSPKDPTLNIAKIMALRNMEGPFVVTSDFYFTGTVLPAFTSVDKGVGAHLAMVETPSPKRELVNPSLQQIIQLQYLGPYLAHDRPPPPWALISTEDFQPEVGEILHLQLMPPEHGLVIGFYDPTFKVWQTPAWDFLAATTRVVFHHKQNPKLDFILPVKAQVVRNRLHFVSSEAELTWSKLLTLADYEGPFFLSSNYQFAVEVHSDTNLPPSKKGRRSLVPIHSLHEVLSNAHGDIYHPHPDEVLRTEMEGPVLRREGAQAAAAIIKTTTGSWGATLFWLSTMGMTLLAFVYWSRYGARAMQSNFGKGSGISFCLAFVLMVALSVFARFSDILWLVDGALVSAILFHLGLMLLLAPQLHLR